ncbi:SDR family oxidoreductase [soil metagenome]
MKVLITGSDGYIGTVMSQVLMDRGHEVTGLDAGFYREGWLYNGVKQMPRVITKDTRNVTLNDLKDFDAVISLADLSNDPLGQTNPENTYDINHKGIIALAKKAKQSGVKRFIYSSSCSVYGIATEDFVTEESAVNPQTAYAKCKYLVEQDLKTLADDTFSPTYMRNATVYGPSPRMRFDLVVNNLSGLAWTENEIKMTSDGTPWRPLVHILDVCEAFAAVLEAPTEIVHNQIFNVGNNNGNYTIKQVAEIIASVFPGCKTSFGTSDGDTRSYRVNFDKITNLLPGFVSTRTIKDGAEDLKKVFESIKMTKELFTFRAFTRLSALNYLTETKQIDEKFFWTT